MNEALNKGFPLYGCPLTIPYIRGRKMRYTHRQSRGPQEGSEL